LNAQAASDVLSMTVATENFMIRLHSLMSNEAYQGVGTSSLTFGRSVVQKDGGGPQ
jgi:hypothetical protein